MVTNLHGGPWSDGAVDAEDRLFHTSALEAAGTRSPGRDGRRESPRCASPASRQEGTGRGSSVWTTAEVQLRSAGSSDLTVDRQPGSRAARPTCAFRTRARASFVRDVIQAPGTGVAITGSDAADSRPDARGRHP